MFASTFSHRYLKEQRRNDNAGRDILDSVLKEIMLHCVTNRKQCVSFVKNGIETLRCTQGSIARLILFTIYINDLPEKFLIKINILLIMLII